ncbi:MAG: prepilin-type N-terminal cleavage/methylation domain-containing protein [Phycisphaerae bacterium]|nr:prepilin-type N-terminal cleavage/methylation domain-containing protein [Phycisphaerae bacterium]
MQTRNRTIRAFTLVEVLTTVAIIGILLAVLIPALNQVGKSALVVKQKAQFHTIEMALEAFRSDVGFYPPSVWDAHLPDSKYGYYSASQRLAEAIIGRDGFGFHTSSQFRADGNGYDDLGNLVPLYAPVVDLTANPDNLAARKGPYLELESANAVQLGQYSTNYGALVNPLSYVLADAFKTAKLTTGRKTGMPILYYRADRSKAGHNAATLDANTYNVMDGINMATVPGPLQSQHPFYPLYSDHSWFYHKTLNPNFTNPPRPYRAESFILHSAGPDGKFGTADDLFNFDEGN